MGICKICGTRKRKEDSERLSPVFKSPEEMHISPHFQGNSSAHDRYLPEMFLLKPAPIIKDMECMLLPILRI